MRLVRGLEVVEESGEAGEAMTLRVCMCKCTYIAPLHKYQPCPPPSLDAAGGAGSTPLLAYVCFCRGSQTYPPCASHPAYRYILSYNQTTELLQACPSQR